MRLKIEVEKKRKIEEYKMQQKKSILSELNIFRFGHT